MRTCNRYQLKLGKGREGDAWHPRAALHSLFSYSPKGFLEAPESCKPFPILYMGKLGPETQEPWVPHPHLEHLLPKIVQASFSTR